MKRKTGWAYLLMEAALKSGLNQTTLAMDAGVNHSYVSAVLQRKRPLTPKLLASFAKTIGLSRDEETYISRLYLSENGWKV